MEVEVTIKPNILEKKRNLKRQKEVLIQDDVFINRNEDNQVFINRSNDEYNKYLNNFRRPFNHQLCSKKTETKFTNQTIFRSHQSNSYEKRKSNFHLDGSFGWCIVFFAVLLKTIANGPILNFNLIYLYLKTKVFPNHQYIEIIGCLNLISSHLISPIITILVFKYKSIRLITILGCILIALSLLFSAFSFQYHQFILSFCLMNGLFSEFIQVCSTIIIVQYFKKKLYFVLMIISLSNGISYSVFGIIIHFLFSEYNWRKSLQLISIITWFSLIFALFFRPISIYHPQRRAILHLKQQKLKQCQSNYNQKKNNYKLSEHFLRHQNLETIKKDFNKTENSLNSDTGNSLNSDTGNSSNSNTGNGNNNIKNNILLNELDNLSTNKSNNRNSLTKLKKKNKFKFLFKKQRSQSTIRQIEQQNSIPKVKSSFNNFLCLFNCFHNGCLNKLIKLVKSNNLIEYLDLIKSSRDLKFIIIFSFLSTTSQIYLTIQYNDNECNQKISNSINNSTISNLNEFNNSNNLNNLLILKQYYNLNKSIVIEDHLINRTINNKKLNLINSFNLVNLSKIIFNQTNSIELMWLNFGYGLSYIISLILTSILISRLYLTSKNCCKLSLIGCCLNLIAINLLNLCLINNYFNSIKNDNHLIRNNSIKNDDHLIRSKPIIYSLNLYSIKLISIIRSNIYLIQIILYIIYAYFQASLNYSIQLLLIERYSNKKLCKVISLQRFIIGFGHLIQLIIRLLINYLNDQFLKLFSIDYDQLIINSIIFILTIIAILFLHFITNRSINRFKNRNLITNKKVVNLEFNWSIRLWNRISKCIYKLFKLENNKILHSKNSNSLDKRTKFRKQLSDSNLNFITKQTNDNLNKFNSDLNLFKNHTQLDKNYHTQFNKLKSLKPNYLIDCILCGRCYLVNLDLDRLELSELCSIEKLLNEDCK